MNLEKSFKKVILFYVAAPIASIIVGLYSSETVEKANEMFDQSNWYANNEGSYLVFLLMTLIVIFFHLYSLYAIYKFKKKGRLIFLYSLITLTVCSLFLGEQAYTVFDLFFFEVTSILSGAILIFLYFTNLTKKFE